MSGCHVPLDKSFIVNKEDIEKLEVFSQIKYSKEFPKMDFCFRCKPIGDIPMILDKEINKDCDICNGTGLIWR